MLYHYENYIMKNNQPDYGWMGWTVAAVIGAVFIFSLINSDSQESNQTTAPVVPTTSVSKPTAAVDVKIKEVQEEASWKCVDATSYNQNAYDDNACTKGGETRYVSDSQALELDPGYRPGKAGASYYNNQ